MLARIIVTVSLITTAVASGQTLRLLLPSWSRIDATSYTGVVSVTPDGRWLGGYETTPGHLPNPALWDMESSSLRAHSLGIAGIVQAMSHDGMARVVYSPGAQPDLCRQVGGCVPLAPLASAFACAPDARHIFGNQMVDGAPRAAISGPDGTFPMPFAGTSLRFGVAGDGSCAYFAQASTDQSAMVYRWRVGETTPALLRRVRWSSERICGVSQDGGRAYFSIPGSLEVYTEREGFQEVVGVGTGLLTSITPDGRRGVGKTPTGNSAGFIWEPFFGVIPLTDIIPSMPLLANSPTISDDGMTIVGSIRAADGRAQAFWLRLPDSFGQPRNDYNRDGNEDQDDLQEYLRYYAGAPNPYGLPLDYNRDGAVDPSDVRDLLYCLAGECP